MRPSTTHPSITTPLLGRQQTPSSGFLQALSGLFGAPQPQPDTGRQPHATQRNDQWLQRLGADTESRAIASQQAELQGAISALLDADPRVVELHEQDGVSTCAFLPPGPTLDTLERLVWIGQTLLQLNNPAAARLLATASDAAQQGFPAREADLLRDCGRALQNSKASLPVKVLMRLCVRTAELVDLGFMKEDDALLFEAAACRSPQGAPYGLRLCLERLRRAFKAMSDQPTQNRQPDALMRLGREIDGLHHQCRSLNQRERAGDALQLLADLVELAQGTSAHVALSTALDKLTDVQRRHFDAPLAVADWYPGLLEGGDPELAARAYQQRPDASAEPEARHEQLCDSLISLVQHGPDRPWTDWAAHLEFAALAFRQQHNDQFKAQFDVALCLDWVCNRPGDAAERLDSLWACMSALKRPVALGIQDRERLLALMLDLPPKASAKAFTQYMGRVHPKLNRRLVPVWALLDAYRQLPGGTAPLEILEQLVARLSQGKHPMAPIPEWDFLMRRFLGSLLTRDKSLDMANAKALRTLLLKHAVSATTPLSALDNTFDLMRTLWQSVQVSATASVPSGADSGHQPDFCTALSTHLLHRFGFGHRVPEAAEGQQRHAEQLMEACLTALQQSLAPPAHTSTASPGFADVYSSLVRARLAQRKPSPQAHQLVQQTIDLHNATLESESYLKVLQLNDPAWQDYVVRLKDMINALGN